MLVIDDNKLKLLRMKEKLLEVSFDNRDLVLSQYKEIVLDVDKDMYNKLIDMIKNANYHNQPLEVQLEFLTNLENEYNSFNEFQCRYRDIYEKYASDSLELSPIEDIYIDKIKERIDAINGYLINNQNLVKYRKILEELNVQLIDAEKKKDAIESRFSLLERELKNSVLNAEGRIDNHGALEYTSIPKEFEKYDLNLGKLLEDKDLLTQKLNDASGALSLEEDKLEAAKVCFSNMPSADTKKLYNASYFDVLNTSYRIILLDFASLIADEYTNYEKIRDKRFKIKMLIKERAKILTDLGVKFAVDPFERIKVSEQLEIIELLGKNLRDVMDIKARIRDNFNIVDGINAKNNELYLKISQEIELFNDRYLIPENTFGFDEINSQDDEKKVVFVRDVSPNLNFGVVHAKTDGVIARVYELFNNVPVESKKEEVVPELVIQKDSNTFSEEGDKKEIFDDNNAIFSDTSFISDNEEKPSIQDSIFEDELDTQEIFTNDSLTDSVNNDIFSEVEPFKETELFTNKYDDVFAGEQNDASMPELSFEHETKVFDDSLGEPVSDELSLDEQIKALKLVP